MVKFGMLLWALRSLLFPALALAGVCDILDGKGEEEQVNRRLERAQEPDIGDSIVERPKQITFNHWNPKIPGEPDFTEAADPTRPISSLDGKTYRVDASGKDGFRYTSLDQLFRGGNQDTKRFPTIKRWKDGTATSGPYHTGNHGWDGLVAKWPIHNAQGKIIGHQEVAYLGMMEKINGATPTMPLHNYTRSRHAMTISYENGVEVWTSQGSVFGHQPLAPSTDERVPMGERGQWVSKNHHHGYGGRPLMDNDGYVFQWDGSYWMIFEQVMEQKVVSHGDGAVGYLPWITEVVARRMKNPYEAYRKGERLPDGRPADETVVICSVKDGNGTFNPASDRHGMGYLIEGFNLMGSPVVIDGKKFWIGFASPNNYTESYGVTLWYRAEKDGPIGPYQPLKDETGAWKDITAEFRKRYGLLGWFGRGDGFFTPQDLKIMMAGMREVPFKMIAHGVNPLSIPKGFPISGWPTAEQYNFYIRSQWLLFGRFYLENGAPAVRWIDPSP